VCVLVFMCVCVSVCGIGNLEESIDANWDCDC